MPSCVQLSVIASTSISLMITKAASSSSFCLFMILFTFVYMHLSMESLLEISCILSLSLDSVSWIWLSRCISVLVDSLTLYLMLVLSAPLSWSTSQLLSEGLLASDSLISVTWDVSSWALGDTVLSSFFLPASMSFFPPSSMSFFPPTPISFFPPTTTIFSILASFSPAVRLFLTSSLNFLSSSNCTIVRFGMMYLSFMPSMVLTVLALARILRLWVLSSNCTRIGLAFALFCLPILPTTDILAFDTGIKLSRISWMTLFSTSPSVFSGMPLRIKLLLRLSRSMASANSSWIFYLLCPSWLLFLLESWLPFPSQYLWNV